MQSAPSSLTAKYLPNVCKAVEPKRLTTVDFEDAVALARLPIDVYRRGGVFGNLIRGVSSFRALERSVAGRHVVGLGAVI
jgi:hypothetical protein